MMAEIKSVSSPDVRDLVNYIPDDEESFAFLLQMMVGPKGGKGEESFDITICTPKWLLQNYKKEDLLFARHRLIVFEYNYDRIFSALKKQIESLTANDWNELAMRISRIAKWEFEDYREKHISPKIHLPPS